MLVHWAPPLMAEALTVMGEGFSLKILSCLKHGRFCHILLARRARTAGTAGWRSSISLCRLRLHAGSAFWVSSTGFLLCGSSPSPPERGEDSLQQTQGWFLPSSLLFYSRRFQFAMQFQVLYCSMCIFLKRRAQGQSIHFQVLFSKPTIHEYS